MPHYLVTIKTHNKTYIGIKDNNSTDLDFVYRHFKALAVQVLGVENIIGFDCLMISEMSAQFRELNKRNKPGKSRRYGNY